jgi:hypothetical protein
VRLRDIPPPTIPIFQSMRHKAAKGMRRMVCDTAQAVNFLPRTAAALAFSRIYSGALR